MHVTELHSNNARPHLETFVPRFETWGWLPVSPAGKALLFNHCIPASISTVAMWDGYGC